MGLKIYNLRTKYNLTQEELAKIMEVSNKTVSAWENGSRSPKIAGLQKLCDRYNINLNRFIDVEDDYYGQQDFSDPIPLFPKNAYTAEETMFIKRYRTLDDYGRAAVGAVLDAEERRVLEESAAREAAEEADGAETEKIPLRLSLQPVSAGKGAYLGPEEFETVFVEKTPLTNKASFAVRVSGNSMEPRYHDGDVLLVERADDIRPGEIGVFTMDGDGYVKKRGDGELISLNPAYPPIPMSDSIWCNGLVIGVLE